MQNKNLTGLICVAIIFFNSALVEVLANPEKESLPSHKDIQFNQIQEKTDGVNLHYAFAGNKNKPGIMFIHGSPGSWSAFQTYLENPQLQRDFFMVSVDRIGWGKSIGGTEKSDNKMDSYFDVQANSVKTIMASYPHTNWTIVGHSLGASIAPKVALVAPIKTKSLLLLAGSLQPDLGKPRWYNRVANTWLIGRLIGSKMRSSNKEIIGLKKQLSLMDSQIKASTLDVDLVVMQGKKDRLVSPKNPQYVKSAWQKNFNSIRLIELDSEGHFLPWNQTELVIETIYSLNKD